MTKRKGPPSGVWVAATNGESTDLRLGACRYHGGGGEANLQNIARATLAEAALANYCSTWEAEVAAYAHRSKLPEAFVLPEKLKDRQAAVERAEAEGWKKGRRPRDGKKGGGRGMEKRAEAEGWKIDILPKWGAFAIVETSPETLEMVLAGWAYSKAEAVRVANGANPEMEDFDRDSAGILGIGAAFAAFSGSSSIPVRVFPEMEGSTRVRVELGTAPAEVVRQVESGSWSGVPKHIAIGIKRREIVAEGSGAERNFGRLPFLGDMGSTRRLPGSDLDIGSSSTFGVSLSAEEIVGGDDRYENDLEENRGGAFWPWFLGGAVVLLLLIALL